MEEREDVFIPEFKKFTDEVKAAYNSGNIRDAYMEVVYHIKNYELDDSVTPVTFSIIMEKWKMHLKLWNMKYADKDPKYLSAAATKEKLNIHDFVKDFKYNDEYSLEKGELKRDDYLFMPGYSTPELYKIFNSIKTKIDAQRKKVSGPL